MGYSTDYVGHIEIDPPLNDAEIEYLTAFCDSRRFVRSSPYDVPGNPWAETSDGVPPELYNQPPPGQPDLWCDWSVCWDGCCLAWNGTEKSYAMIAWLRYLIAHFLRPGGRAARDPRFGRFSFDHRLDGMVVGCRRDTKELFVVKVTNNRVTERILRAGESRFTGYPALPYEAEIDRQQADLRRRRRRPGQTDGGVVQLDDRR